MYRFSGILSLSMKYKTTVLDGNADSAQETAQVINLEKNHRPKREFVTLEGGENKC
jgi:hypothetical protein